jgi:hypothetical protein
MQQQQQKANGEWGMMEGMGIGHLEEEAFGEVYAPQRPTPVQLAMGPTQYCQGGRNRGGEDEPERGKKGFRKG